MIVLNKHHFKNKPLPDNTVYIGRGSKWGNPFTHLDGTKAEFKCDSREEAILAYKTYLMCNQPLLDCLDELKGKNLLCYCSPRSCHGDLLLKLANSDSEYDEDIHNAFSGSLGFSHDTEQED